MREKIIPAYNILLKCLLVTALLMNTVAWGAEIVGPLLKVFLAAAGLLILLDLFNRRQILKDPSLYLLVAFCACYAVTILKFRDYYLSKNIKALAYMAVFFIVLYGGAQADRESARRERFIVGHTFLAGTLLLTLGSLATFFMGLESTYETATGLTGYLGVFNGKLAGLYNSNTGGALYATAIMICAAYLYDGRGGRGRWLYIADIAVTSFCLLLTYSRASIYALAIVLGLGTVILSGRAFDGMKGAAGILVRILAGAGICALLIFASGPVHSMLMRLGPYDFDTEEAAEIAGPVRASIQLPASSSPEGWSEESDRINDTLSRRLSIWNVGWQIFEYSPVWGVTNEAIPDMAFPHLHYPGEIAHIKGGGLHNIYLTVLAASGIAGALPLAVFAVILAADLIRHRRKLSDPACAVYVCGVLTVLMYLAMELMESRILYRFDIFFVIFWYVLGQARAAARAGKEA